MPLYEYGCDACRKVHEVMQKVDAAPLSTCPTCGGSVKKLVSAPAVHFKGQGWYVTDYAGKKSDSAPAKAESTTTSESTTKTSDTKPAPSASPAKD